MYTQFAQVYDRLMQDVDYDGWAAYYRELLTRYGLPRGRVCECACGTGNLTIPLSRMGYQMTGVDMSQEMLWEAAQKARKQGAPIPFIRQDMRQLRLHRPMDAILATCDGVNYLTSEEDVKAFFAAAFNAVRPGGGLFFDLSSPFKLKNTLGNNLLGEDTENITYLWQNNWSEAKHQVELQLCIFIRQEDGSYQRIDEVQTQRAHSMLELDSWLREAGFAHVNFYGDRTFVKPGEKEMRWHVAALRRQEPDSDAPTMENPFYRGIRQETSRL